MHNNSNKFIIIIFFSVVVSSCSTLMFNPGKNIFNEGEELFNKGDCNGSKLKFKEALKKDPEQWKCYYYMAACASKEGDFINMLQLAQKALPHISKNSDERNMIKTLLSAGGQEALKKNNYEDAILLFKESILLDQGDSSPHLWLGNAFLERGEKGDMKNAIIEFKTALNKSNNREKDTKQIGDYLKARAIKYSSQGDYYTASRCYLANTENFNPQDPEVYIELGKIFMKMDNPSGALYYGKKAYALDPNNKEAIDLMGEINSPIQH